MQKNISLIKMRQEETIVDASILKQWNDWRWQLQNSVRTIETVEKVLDASFSDQEKDKLQATLDAFPMAITPYYLSLVDPDNFRKDPVFRQAFPDIRELDKSGADMRDPLAEDKDSPVPGITHRYPDRVLFHVSNTCAMYCRHCTRKRKVGDKDSIPGQEQLREGISYIREHPEVRDVLLSGGDPFLLPDEMILKLLDEISSIRHVEIIRIGTRTPVVLPFRITEALASALSQYDNLWINTHFNHPRELTPEARTAVSRLAKAGIPLGNQSVLLSGVNDCPEIMKKLVRKLVSFRIRPYYLYQCDLSEGLEHFRTSVGRGIEIMENLRGHTSGLAVPTYVVDAPGGGGKIPVMPNYLVSWSGSKVVLRNYEGVITTYEEPRDYENKRCDLDCASCSLEHSRKKSAGKKTSGVSGLLADHEDTITLTPGE